VICNSSPALHYHAGVSIADVALDMMDYNTGCRIYRVGAPVRDVAIEHGLHLLRAARGDRQIVLSSAPKLLARGNARRD
jgi:hypothetical protein